MLAQASPIGVNVTSPVTWFVIAVVGIVLALTLSTRRATVRRPTTGAPVAVTVAGQKERDDHEWSAAQTLFLDDPRAGCERARAIVAGALRERAASVGTATNANAAPAQYDAACAVLRRDDASTDDLRAAFAQFRRAFASIA